MSFLTPKSQPLPPIEKAPPPVRASALEVQAAADEQAKRISSRKGYAATMLTASENQAPVRKSILG